MNKLSRPLHLERRRLTLAGGLAFVAGYALYAHILVLLTASVTTFVFPGLRRLIDSVAVTRLAFALWVIAAQGQDLAASPAISAAIVVGGAGVLLRLGTTLARLGQGAAAPALLASLTARASALAAWVDNAAARAETTSPLRGVLPSTHRASHLAPA